MGVATYAERPVINCFALFCIDLGVVIGQSDFGRKDPL